MNGLKSRCARRYIRLASAYFTSHFHQVIYRFIISLVASKASIVAAV